MAVGTTWLSGTNKDRPSRCQNQYSSVISSIWIQGSRGALRRSLFFVVPGSYTWLHCSKKHNNIVFTNTAVTPMTIS